ncbi:MAG: interleukin-like EMT inducer domain-containing protein [Anaerolineae bacterium]
MLREPARGSRPAAPRGWWWLHLWALLLYVAISLVLTYPLVGQLATHVPGDGGDDPALVWNLWWVPHALIRLRTSPFFCDFLFYPIGINLAFYTLTVWNAFLSVPLQGVVGLVATSNAVLLSSFVLSAYGAFLLARYLLACRSRLQRDRDGVPLRLRAFVVNPVEAAAWLAGFVYGFASPKMFYAALGQFNIASSQWMPFYVLYLVRAFRAPRRWREWAMAALFLAFQAWSELTYASFLALFTGAYALGWLAVRVWRREARVCLRPVPGLFLLGVLTLVAISPVLAAMLPDMLAEGDFFVEGSGFAEVFSADLLGFWLPTQLHPWWGEAVATGFAFPKDKGQHLYLGYGAFVLAVVGLALRRKRRQIFFALGLLGFGLLALGPKAHLNGQEVGPPLPFDLLQELPFFKGNRYPGRFSVVVLLCLAVLAAYGAAEVLRRFHRPRWRRAVGASLALAMALEYLSIPLPLSDMQIPPAYGVLKDVPGEEWAVLDLPLAWRNGFRIFGLQDPVFMYAQFYQTAHGGRLLSGNTSRNPELKFQYFVEAPLLNNILALENGHALPPGRQEADARLALDVLRFLNVRYVVVHRVKASEALQEYVHSTLPVTLIYEDPGYQVYRVERMEGREGKVRTFSWEEPLDRLALAEGWSGPSNFEGETVMWAERQRTHLLIPGGGGALLLRARIFAPGTGQEVRLIWNGQDLGGRPLLAGWTEPAWEVPAGMVRQGINRVEMRWARTYPPLSIPVEEPVGQTGIRPAAHIYVRSAGLEVGWFGHIYVNGRDVSPGGRGYNVAVMDPESGEVQRTASFDTHADEAASHALAAFLEAVPEGQLVAVAVNDEASLHLTEEAVAALRSVGAVGDLRSHFRWGHAVIGVKGARPGEALEGVGLLEPVSLAAGQALTKPQVAGALEWLRVEGQP